MPRESRAYLPATLATAFGSGAALVSWTHAA